MPRESVSTPSSKRFSRFIQRPTSITPTAATGLLFFPSESREKDEDATLKIDHKINATNALYARYVFNWYHDPNSGHEDFLPGDLGAESAYNKIQAFAVGLTTHARACLYQ